MRSAWVICLKDLRQRLRDRTALLVSLVVPMLLIPLLGASLGSGERSFHMRLAIVDLDASPVSTGLGDFVRRRWPETVVGLLTLPSAQAARDTIDAGELDAALVLPAGFAAGLAAGAAPRLQLLAQARNALAARMASGLAASFVRRAEGGPPVRTRLAPMRRIRVVDYFAASLTVLFVSFAVLAGVRAFQAEQDERTLTRLAATPATARAILLGKFGALLVLGLTQMTLMIVFCGVFVGTRWGHPLAVAGLVTTTVLYAVGLTSFVVSATGNAERGRLLATIIIFFFAVVGGQFLPPQGLPDVFDTLARLTPSGQALRGFTSLAASGDAEPGAVIEPLLVTGGLGVAGIAYGARRARRALLGDAT